MAQTVSIPAPKMETALFSLIGTAPLMIYRFDKKAEMQADMAEGKPARSKRKRPPRDFSLDAAGACYRSADGWNGMNASAFRNAMISACRLVGFRMTLAKLSIFIEADGFDERDYTPLVRIYPREPAATPEGYEVRVMSVRNATGVIDLRARPLWAPGWRINLPVRWDADQFVLGDIANLLARVGLQGGIGEGRPDSKQSAGIGFGLFRIEGEAGA